jgi:hypothetical protein
MSAHGVEGGAGGRRSWLRKWGEAHSEGGEQLAYRCTEYDREPFWEFSIWLDWTRFGIGVDAEREYGSLTWADRLHLALNIGPLTFSAVRTWNDPTRAWPVIGRISATSLTPPGAGTAASEGAGS